jgi:hypothetical protein
MRRIPFVTGLIALVLSAHAPAAAYVQFAFQNSSGSVVELAFGSSTIEYYVDGGGTGTAGADATTLTLGAFSYWNNITTSDLTLQLAGRTAGDITTNSIVTIADPFFGETYDADLTLNEVIFDADAGILNKFFGGTPGLLGIALPQSDETTGRIVKANFIIFPTNLDLSTQTGRDQLVIVLAHEAGHTVGFAHTPTAPDNPSADPTHTPVMYPFLVADTTVLQPDDIALVSSVYPSSTASSTFGRVTGSVRSGTGEGLFGAVVELFSSSNTTLPVLGVLSGAGQVPGSFSYSIDGVPPGIYYARIETVDINFDKRRIGGIYESAAVNFPIEIYLNSTEFASARTITVSAGQTSSNVNFGLSPPGSREKVPEGVAYPAPFLPHRGGTIKLRFPDELPLQQFRIYAIDGRLVATRAVDGGAADGVWDGRSASGEMVGSGIYFYELEALNGKTARGRFTLVR